jgi:hypothetical protein
MVLESPAFFIILEVCVLLRPDLIDSILSIAFGFSSGILPLGGGHLYLWLAKS